ncbi:Uncharacterised protein [Vibrio cholerae]|nr:Uncharacterised protein [Vibrio cholerae]CSB61396.1 Uncharacterised protein [Vibrio cholerae]CSH88631.1 Uncharacterised protein [Vibrio cholerae]
MGIRSGLIPYTPTQQIEQNKHHAAAHRSDHLKSEHYLDRSQSTVHRVPSNQRRQNSRVVAQHPTRPRLIQ